MKVLPQKVDVLRKKNLDRELEIKEGVKLAKRVDSLRQMSAEEEERLNLFRTNSLKRIKIEIDNALSEKDSVQQEVAVLKEERILAQAPIDLVTEWKKVKEDQKEVEGWKSDLLNRETSVISRETEVESKEKEFVERDEKLHESENLTSRYLDEAHGIYTKAQDTFLEAQNRLQEAENVEKEHDRAFRTKQAELDIQERDNMTEREHIAREWKEIAEERLHIKSQQQTLKTAWDAIKKLQAKK